MESVINKLAEIETAATKIMQAAENQKKLQDEQQEEQMLQRSLRSESQTREKLQSYGIKIPAYLSIMRSYGSAAEHRNTATR